MATQKHTGNNPLANMFDSIGSAFSGGVSSDQMSKAVTGSEGSGGALSSALSAGAASNFNPYVMAGTALLGLAKSKSENERIEKMGKARAQQEKAAGIQKKSDIQGKVASSIHTALGAAAQKNFRM